MIRLKHIYKSYHMGEVDVPALRDVNLHVKPREFVSVLGPSGSGKSTLMNIVGCLDIPDSGEYFLDGEIVANCTENELSEIRGVKIGFIFQQFNLIPELTAYENVEMPLLYRKISKQERHERVMKTLKQVGLEERIHHKPTRLSGGQQQRVVIARMLAAEPSIILADEPTGNLDSASGKEIMVWTFNEEDDIEYFMTSDAEAIITDSVKMSGEIKQQLSERTPFEIILQKVFSWIQ